MNYNIIYYENNAYEVVHDIAIHMFQNKNGTVNQKVLGMYVHEWRGDKVLQKENRFLICKRIEEAQIVG